MLASTHIPLDTRIYHREAKTLAENGHRITIATMSNHVKPDDRANIDFKIFERPENRFKRLFDSLKLLKWALLSEADVFQIHDIDILYFAPILKILKRKKIIFDAHETFVENFSIKKWIPKFLRPSVALLVKLYEKFNTSFVYKVIVPVEIIGQRYGKKAYLLRNFPIIEKNYIDFPKKQNSICYVGGLYKERRIEWIIELASKLKNYHELKDYTIEVYGPVFPHSEIQHYEELAKNIDSDYLKMHPQRITFEKAKEVFARSRFGLCFFEDKERFHLSLPVKVFEYMAFSAIPVLSSIKSMQNYIDHMENGIFVEDENQEKLLEFLVQLHHDPSKMENISKKAYRDASEKYNWKMESKRLLDLYSKI
ncbi:MAG: glycosyltransferase [Candidatus Zixiibacteriota bacterium]